jgi:LacI family transcriptional regulator
VVPQLENLVYAEIVSGAEKAARARDYTLLVARHGDGMGDASVYRQIADVNRVDGLIIAPLTPDETLHRQLEGLNIPFVVVHRRIRSVEHCITIDSFTAVRQCMRYLIGLGHRRIAFLARLYGYYNDADRLAGYRAALEEAGLPVDESLIVHTPHTRSDAEATIRRLMEAGWPLPTAIFNVTLIAAAGIMTVLAERRVRVPEDLSIMALYDNAFAELLSPPVTTMRMPLQQMGGAGVDMLVDMLDHDGAPRPHLLAPGEILVRRSTAPPPVERTAPLPLAVAKP